MTNFIPTTRWKRGVLTVAVASLLAVAVTTETSKKVQANPPLAGAIVEYKVVRGSYNASELFERGREEFVAVVNEMLGKGWEPLGGVSVSSSVDAYDTFILITQAMVRRR